VALVVLASVLVLVIALTAGAMVMVDRLDSRIKRFPDPFAGLPTRPPVVTPAPSESGAVPAEHAVTVLVLGSTDDVAVAGPDGWAAAAALTDVVLLAHVSADRRSAQVIAMPPDLWVDVPGSGPGALRSALALGGPPRAVQTVEQLTDVRVDHVALTDAATFARVTEALGGVDLDVANDVVVRGRLLIRAGHRHLSGEQTLLWVQGGGDGDSGRAKREEAWLRAILNRVGEADVRQDPTRWLQLLSVVSGSVAVDEGLDRSTLVGLLASMRGLQPADVDVVVAPTTTGTSADGQPVLVPDSAPFAALMDALRTDTLSQHLAAAGASG
jgi:LCP family protein required for cell wall assembly